MEYLKKIKGFTLVELLVVIVIIAIIASIALPAYMTYSIRARVLEGIQLTSAAKLVVFEAASTIQDLNIAATQWNLQSGNSGIVSKYVSSILITPQGNIIISYSGAVGLAAAANTLVYSPYIRSTVGSSLDLSAALAANITGTVDWACASATASVAINQGMATPMLGTLPPKYAPSQCR